MTWQQLKRIFSYRKFEEFPIQKKSCFSQPFVEQLWGESAFATANQGFRRSQIILLLALLVIFVDPPQNIFQIGEEVSAIYSVEYIKV